MGSRYTAAQFIKAIPGTGGIITALAKIVGCDWHTAKKYITAHATVAQAWQNERSRITDRAQHNIVKAILGDEDTPGDVQLSKWWLQVMDPEFTPKQKMDVTSGGEKLAAPVIYLPETEKSEE